MGDTALWKRLESLGVLLVSLHSLLIGAGLIFATDWILTFAGWSRVGSRLRSVRRTGVENAGTQEMKASRTRAVVSVLSRASRRRWSNRRASSPGRSSRSSRQRSASRAATAASNLP